MQNLLLYWYFHQMSYLLTFHELDKSGKIL